MKRKSQIESSDSDETLKLKKKMKKLEKELLHYKNEYLLAERIKNEFLSQMSHELRTPVNIILNAAELLGEHLGRHNTSNTKEVITILNSAGKRIHRTIELIVNMAELQSGKYPFSPVYFDLCKGLKEVLYSEFKNRTEEKDLDFNWFDCPTESIIHGDPYSVTQIFFHLLDNAVKFTNMGHVEILFENNAGKIIVAISDTGIGIEEEFRPYLFKAFTQEDRGYSRRFEGNGLGLAIVKKFCDLNSAKIEIDSKKGIGTRVKVVFDKADTKDYSRELK